MIVLIANIHSMFVGILCLVQNKAQNKQKYQQKRPASRDIFSGAVKLPIIGKGFENSLATQVPFSVLFLFSVFLDLLT
ncbi:hypothetical protein RM11_1008 [Bartonella quintana RM-11]|nr:hypothetical protein RM11_0934 [Bartonella quintana RM-11]AFR26711.1 hypothetical protein RM11_1008 [Bartonella quintana RM-11]